MGRKVGVPGAAHLPSRFVVEKDGQVNVFSPADGKRYTLFEQGRVIKAALSPLSAKVWYLVDESTGELAVAPPSVFKKLPLEALDFTPEPGSDVWQEREQESQAFWQRVFALRSKTVPQATLVTV